MLALLLAFVAQSGNQVYFGNLHSHTSFSDGSGTPTVAFDNARAHGLDFLAITEHNHASAEGTGETDPPPTPIHIARTPELYTGPRADALMPVAMAKTVDGQFVALYGQEFSTITKGNHVNVFDIGAVIEESQVPKQNFAKLVEWLALHPDSLGKPAIIQFNHPSLWNSNTDEYGRDDFGSVQNWKSAMGKHAALIEVLNGSATAPTGSHTHRAAEFMEADYLFYLNEGFHLAPTGDQDNHFRTWGSSTDARTAVIAPSLTKAAILEGMRNRHVYATEDENLRLIATVNGKLQGDRITAFPGQGEELAIQLQIADDDEPGLGYTVEVFSDDHAGGPVAKVVETVVVDGNGTYDISGATFRGEGQYVFLRVTQVSEDHGSDQAWLAPVWFEASPPVAILTLHIDSIVPDPVGSDEDLEHALIHNPTTSSVSLVGWRLRDASGKAWDLSSLGTLAPNQAKTIHRHGQAMSMNNRGDEVIELVSPTAGVVDEMRYTGAAEGQEIPHPPMVIP